MRPVCLPLLRRAFFSFSRRIAFSRAAVRSFFSFPTTAFLSTSRSVLGRSLASSAFFFSGSGFFSAFSRNLSLGIFLMRSHCSDTVFLFLKIFRSENWFLLGCCPRIWMLLSWQTSLKEGVSLRVGASLTRESFFLKGLGAVSSASFSGCSWARQGVEEKCTMSSQAEISLIRMFRLSKLSSRLEKQSSSPLMNCAWERVACTWSLWEAETDRAETDRLEMEDSRQLRASFTAISASSTSIFANWCSSISSYSCDSSCCFSARSSYSSSSCRLSSRLLFSAISFSICSWLSFCRQLAHSSFPFSFPASASASTSGCSWGLLRGSRWREGQAARGSSWWWCWKTKQL